MFKPCTDPEHRWIEGTLLLRIQRDMIFGQLQRNLQVKYVHGNIIHTNNSEHFNGSVKHKKQRYFNGSVRNPRLYLDFGLTSDRNFLSLNTYHLAHICVHMDTEYRSHTAPARRNMSHQMDTGFPSTKYSTL